MPVPYFRETYSIDNIWCYCTRSSSFTLSRWAALFLWDTILNQVHGVLFHVTKFHAKPTKHAFAIVIHEPVLAPFEPFPFKPTGLVACRHYGHHYPSPNCCSPCWAVSQGCKELCKVDIATRVNSPGSWHAAVLECSLCMQTSIRDGCEGTGCGWLLQSAGQARSSLTTVGRTGCIATNASTATTGHISACVLPG